MPIEWRVSTEPVDYADAIATMEERVAAIARGEAPELVWLLEHPPLYTAGTSARAEDLLEPRFPVHRTGRGGKHTYHGPGQRIAYVMLDLARFGHDLRGHVCRLEDWLIRTLARLGVRGERRAGRVGIWVVREDGREEKIAAVGVRVRRWVTYHGIALNVCPSLDHFAGIVPCGIREHGVTSLRALGFDVPMPEIDALLRDGFDAAFATPSATQRPREAGTAPGAAPCSANG
jgi:lipoyl(octanoyl) transferase